MKALKLLLSLTLMWICIEAKATHLVGGEFTLQHNTGFNYTLTMNLYFDNFNGSPGAEDQVVRASFFRNRDGAFMDSLFLLKVSNNQIVPYTNPSCAKNFLQTRVIVYRNNITFDTAKFKDPSGYHVVWERCCRNNGIINIDKPGKTGQAFVLKFPAIVKNGQPFVNSSPTLLKPLSDFACIAKPFWFDFSGIDPDGDSLVYRLTSPIAGASDTSAVRPRPTPIPHRRVSWATGFSETEQISGTLPLRIEPTTGVLNLNASLQGLFVFAVQIDEYRNGEYLGSVFREYQLLVIDCVQNFAPELEAGKRNGSGAIIIADSQVVYFPSQDDNCIDLSFKTRFSPTQLEKQIKIRAVNNNPGKPVIVLKEYNTLLKPENPIENIDVCLPRCNEYSAANPMKVTIYVSDNDCPRPMADTLVFFAIVDPLPELNPILEVDKPATGKVKLQPFQSFPINYRGRDSLGQTVYLSVEKIVDEDIISQGTAVGINGKLSGSFDLRAACSDVGKDVRYRFVLYKEGCTDYLYDIDTIAIEVTDTTDFGTISSSLQTNDEDSVFYLIIKPKEKLNFWVEGKGSTGQQFSLLLDSAQSRPGRSGAKIKYDYALNPRRARYDIEWEPQCSMVPNGRVYEHNLTFRLKTQTCEPGKTKRMYLYVTVKDTIGEAFLPTNIITANNDGVNDALDWTELIPPDNCDDEFKAFEIYNRWGSRVFETRERDLNWNAKNVDEGVYFYHLGFKNRTYKGWITVMK